MRTTVSTRSAIWIGRKAAEPSPTSGVTSDWRRHVDRLEVLAATAVNDTGTIDDGVDAGKARPPDLGRRIAVEIGGDSLDSWKLVVQRLRVADDRDHVMATRPQTGQQLSPDEAVCAGQQYPHGATVRA
jgi:hypothetical protein